MFLMSMGFEVVGPRNTLAVAGTKAGGPAVFIDDLFNDRFDDELADDELVWAQRLEPLLADVLAQPLDHSDWESSTSPSPRSTLSVAPSVRQEAAQALGRLSEQGSPACRLAFARAIVEKVDTVVQVLLAQEGTCLPEAYPLAAALKFTAFCPEAAETLADSDLPTLLVTKAGGVVGLLAREVENTLRVISEGRQQASDEVAYTMLIAAEPAQPKADVKLFDKEDASGHCSASGVSTTCASSATWGRCVSSASTGCSTSGRSSWQPRSTESLPRVSSITLNLDEDFMSDIDEDGDSVDDDYDYYMTGLQGSTVKFGACPFGSP
jgi:hypothetical protein